MNSQIRDFNSAFEWAVKWIEIQDEAISVFRLLSFLRVITSSYDGASATASLMSYGIKFKKKMVSQSRDSTVNACVHVTSGVREYRCNRINLYNIS